MNIKCFFPIKAAAFLEPAQGVYVLSGLLVCAAPTVDAFPFDSRRLACVKREHGRRIYKCQPPNREAEQKE